MKKEYIKPSILNIITMSENIMEEFASNYKGPGSGKVGKDDSPDEVDAAAKGFNAWTAWDEE